MTARTTKRRRSASRTVPDKTGRTAFTENRPQRLIPKEGMLAFMLGSFRMRDASAALYPGIFQMYPK